MANIDEVDGYSDEDLDALPSDTFLELQQHAIHSTQQPDLNRAHASITGKTASAVLPDTLIVNAKSQNSNRIGDTKPTTNHYEQPSSDYGDLDDELLDGEILDVTGAPAFVDSRVHLPRENVVDEALQREQWRAQRYASPLQHQASIVTRNTLKHSTVPRDAYEEKGGDDDILDDSIGELSRHSKPLKPSESVNALQAKVEQLLREREALQQAVKEANEKVLAKTGEISIVRANQAKTSKDFEKQVATLQKLHADEKARQKAEITNARAEGERIATENRFLKQDLTEETGRTRDLQRNTKDKTGKPLPTSTANEDTVLTPRKAKALPFRDGFDDNEIVMVSPTKAVGNLKPVTPKAGGKRKRKNVDDSPGQPLQLSQRKNVQAPDDPMQSGDEPPLPIRTKLQKSIDQRFQLTQRILNHRISGDERRSFEALADYKFFSDPGKALSTIILDKMSALRIKVDIEDFPAAIANIMILLWSQCINEVFYEPLRLLMDLVKFILLISPSSTAPHLVDSLVQLTQSTADVHVIPRFHRKPLTDVKGEIDTHVCLQILHLCATGCMRQQEDITRFWRCMRFDFILMTLRIFQPIEDIHMMLNILRTSVMKNTFAMIVIPEKADQAKSEHHVIDRVTAMLIEVPRVGDGEEPYDAVEVAEMRLLILEVMESMCDSRHGTEALAKNPFAIGRLVRVMNDELNALYDDKYGHEQRSELVNQSTRLLFHLTSLFPGINMQEKLRVIPGGTHKHLIALTRLAFSEGIFYERGIEDDVVDCAHQMLEDSVTPEEGEALLEAFSSARR